MENMNYNILIENIESLMRQQGINQARLIEATGIPQPQMSKCLSRSNKGRFTFEQIWKIADFFKVSIDFLVGRKLESDNCSPLTTVAVCKQLMRLIESEMVTWKEIAVEENMYTEDGFAEPYDYPYRWSKGTNKYTAFFFSNFINPDTTDLPEPVLDELQYDFGTCGNEAKENMKINDFLVYYLKLTDLLKKNDLPQEIFDIAIADRLKSME